VWLGMQGLGRVVLVARRTLDGSEGVPPDTVAAGGRSTEVAAGGPAAAAAAGGGSFRPRAMLSAAQEGRWVFSLIVCGRSPTAAHGAIQERRLWTCYAERAGQMQVADMTQ
jgi:hypothetical protein